MISYKSKENIHPFSAWIIKGRGKEQSRNFLILLECPKHKHHPWKEGNPWTKGQHLANNGIEPERREINHATHITFTYGQMPLKAHPNPSDYPTI
jgi:hypothetical protein